jgi:DNA-directed RNA polymerase specialized sigma24 family protein
MKLLTILEQLRGNHRYATADDIRKVFGDYHNALHWLAVFLIGDEKLADACIVDACTIAQTQTAMFHEWLIHWAALATLRSALRTQQPHISELAAEYDKGEPVDVKHPFLSPKDFQLLVKNSEDMRASLDVLCRFVLVMHGIAKDSCEEVAARLGVSQRAVERAYSIAFDTLEGASSTDVSTRASVAEVLQ